MKYEGLLKVPDYIAIAVYVCGLVFLGMWISYRRRESKDLFLAGRTLPWYAIGLSILATNVGPGFLIASYGIAWKTGIVNANFEWLAWIFILIFGMLFFPHYVSTRVTTIPQFINHRFGAKAYTIFTWYSLFNILMLWLGGTLYTGALLFSQIMGWPFWASLLFLMAVTTSFTAAGGLAAVVYTDFFQGILIIIGSLVMTLIAYNNVGGMDNFMSRVPADYWKLLKPASDPLFPWYAIVFGYPILGIWYWCADQTIVQRILGARDMRHGQLACVFTGFLKILPPFLFIIPGILCYALHPDLKDADDAFVTMLRNYMPAGLTGMMVAVFLAMLVSTIDSAINAFSTLFTVDIYQRHFRPGAGPEQVAKVGRIMTIVTAFIALGMAFTWKTFDEELWRIGGVLMSAVAPTVATVFLFGVLWKRATKASALITMCSGAAVCWSAGLLNLWGIPYEGFWPPYMVMTIYGFLFSSAVMTVSTLCTRNARDEQPLDSLRESYRKYGGLTRAIWVLWAILAAVMAAIYIVFD